MTRTRIATAAVLAAGVFATISFDVAEARRGGSFGSRGMRTYSAPPTTRTAPTQTQPVQRSMTAQQPTQGARAPAPATAARTQPRTGMFSNPLVRGLLLGGLLGALLGFGFGGMGGGLAAILQIAVVALGAMLLFRLFANRRRSAEAATPVGGQAHGSRFEMQEPARPAEPNRYFATTPPVAAPAGEASDDIGVTQADLDQFEGLLKEVQGAFGAEDYAALRERTTPEIMSYLSEELSQNATQGRRNEVTDISLEQGDLSEAWREDDKDYATVAMRYVSRDVMRDRTSGKIVGGDADEVTETTELWTFVRQGAQSWKVSAIQDA